jgi:hypothetical protein
VIQGTAMNKNETRQLLQSNLEHFKKNTPAPDCAGTILICVSELILEATKETEAALPAVPPSTN